MKQQFYVYYLIDPRTSQVFYIGKGKGNRMYYHEQEVKGNYKTATKPHHGRIREILESGLQVTYEKVLVNATETYALKREKELIEQYGRLNNGTGTLLNLTAGGSNGGKTELPVSQYALDGTFINHYSSAKAASEMVDGANGSYIGECCRGKRRSSGGYLWTYKGDPIPVFTKLYHRKVAQYSLDGNLIKEYRSLTEAQTETGVELHNISESCRGKSKKAGGYIWKYLE